MKHVVEVKAVPIALFENLPIKEYNKKQYPDVNYNQKIGVFPVGYKKNKNSPISERAIKHLVELGRLISDNIINTGCCLFVVGRNDVSSFSPSKEDPYYCKAINEAVAKGVQIKAIKIEWIKNSAYYRGEIPVVLD